MGLNRSSKSVNWTGFLFFDIYKAKAFVSLCVSRNNCHRLIVSLSCFYFYVCAWRKGMEWWWVGVDAQFVMLLFQDKDSMDSCTTPPDPPTNFFYFFEILEFILFGSLENHEQRGNDGYRTRRCWVTLLLCGILSVWGSALELVLMIKLQKTPFNVIFIFFLFRIVLLCPFL